MTTTTTTDGLTATWTKLRDGTWGIRVAGPGAEHVGVGDTVRVTKRTGAARDEVIHEVVWSGRSVALCTASPFFGRR